MGERLAWDDIKQQYPDQWIGLTEVKYKPDNDASIASAVVSYINKSKDELTRMQIQTDGALVAIYTTPDHVFQLGTVGYFG